MGSVRWNREAKHGGRVKTLVQQYLNSTPLTDVMTCSNDTEIVTVSPGTYFFPAVYRPRRGRIDVSLGYSQSCLSRGNECGPCLVTGKDFNMNTLHHTVSQQRLSTVLEPNDCVNAISHSIPISDMSSSAPDSFVINKNGSKISSGDNLPIFMFVRVAIPRKNV